MATIADIARHASVSIEGVLRVLNREPVSEDVQARVLEAMDFHGFPRRAVTQPALEESFSRAKMDIVQTVKAATAELEESLPRDVGGVVIEAMRIEVKPVAQDMARALQQLTMRVHELRAEVSSERRERLEDIALLIDLVSQSWRNVDQRLGRVEKMLGRLQPEPGETPRAQILRMEDRQERREATDEA